MTRDFAGGNQCTRNGAPESPDSYRDLLSARGEHSRATPCSFRSTAGIRFRIRTASRQPFPSFFFRRRDGLRCLTAIADNLRSGRLSVSTQRLIPMQSSIGPVTPMLLPVQPLVNFVQSCPSAPEDDCTSVLSPCCPPSQRAIRCRTARTTDGTGRNSAGADWRPGLSSLSRWGALRLLTLLFSGPDRECPCMLSAAADATAVRQVKLRQLVVLLTALFCLTTTAAASTAQPCKALYRGRTLSQFQPQVTMARKS